MKYAYSFVVLCFIVFISSVLNGFMEYILTVKKKKKKF